MKPWKTLLIASLLTLSLAACGSAPESGEEPGDAQEPVATTPTDQEETPISQPAPDAPPVEETAGLVGTWRLSAIKSGDSFASQEMVDSFNPYSFTFNQDGTFTALIDGEAFEVNAADQTYTFDGSTVTLAGLKEISALTVEEGHLLLPLPGLTLYLDRE